MASLGWFVPRGQPRMCQLQWQMKVFWSLASEDSAKLVPLLEECREFIGWWLQEVRWASGIPLQVSPPSLLLYIDVSMTGGGTHLQDLTLMESGLGEKELLNNVIEMKAAQLTLNAFLPRILGKLVILMSNNTTVVAYLKKQKGAVCGVMCSLIRDIMTWTELHSVTLSARYIILHLNGPV